MGPGVVGLVNISFNEVTKQNFYRELFPAKKLLQFIPEALEQQTLEIGNSAHIGK